MDDARELPKQQFESPIFLGKRAEALSALIERQFEPIFQRQDIVVPVRSCSLLLHLHRQGSASAADLAESLGMSHQLVLQKIPLLVRRELIRRSRDPRDRRRRILSLTIEGARQVALLERQAAHIAQVYRELYAEIGSDLFVALGRALEALQNKDLASRFAAIE